MFTYVAVDLLAQYHFWGELLVATRWVASVPGPDMPADRPGSPYAQQDVRYPTAGASVAQVVGLAISPLQAAMQAHLFAAPTAFSAKATAAMEQELQVAQLCDEGHRVAGPAIPLLPARVTFKEPLVEPAAAPAAAPAQSPAAPPSTREADDPSAQPVPISDRPEQQRDQRFRRAGKAAGRRPSNAPQGTAGEPRRSSRHSSHQPPPPVSSLPVRTRRPDRAEPFLPTVDGQPAQQQQQPARPPPPPQLPAFELPGRAALPASSMQPSPEERLTRILSAFKGAVTVTQMAELCADQRASRLLAQLAPAAAQQPAVAPATYAAALTAVPAATAQMAHTTATGGVFVLSSTASPAPAAPAQSAVAQPPQPPLVVLKDVGSMPYIDGRILQGHLPYKNGLLRLHLDTGAGMSCVSQATVDRLMPQLAAKGGARVRLVYPVAIHVVGEEISYAREMVVGAQFLVGKALLRVNMLIVPHMPVDFLLGMDCIPMHNMCFDWGINQLSMHLHPSITAPGVVLRRDEQGREMRQQYVRLYTKYSKMSLPCVKP